MQRQDGVADFAMSVLKWTYLTRRPLSLDELRHALAVNSTDTSLDRNNLISEKSLLNCCLGLIVIDGGTSTVRLVHPLLQEYLHSQHEKLFGMGHNDIAQACLTYVNSDIFRGEGAELDELLEKFPLFEYVSCHWGYHIREQATQSVQELALSVLLQPTTFQSISQVLWRSLCPYLPMRPIPFSRLHLITYFGASNIARLLIEHINTEPKDVQQQVLNSWEDVYSCRTPLCAAVRYGHEALVRLLLEQDNIDVDTKNTFIRTALSYAAEYGRKELVPLLLKRDDVDINSKDSSGRTPLWYAVFQEQEAVVQLLLERDDIEVNDKCTINDPPLQNAALYGMDAIVRLFLKRSDVDVNIRNNFQQTPLSQAAEQGHEAVVRLLLERDNIDVNVKDHMGRTPLSLATGMRREAVVRLLLEWDGIDVNAEDDIGQTPLNYAINCGCEAVVRLLQERGAVKGDPNNAKRAPTFGASGSGLFGGWSSS
jgi:ankyrin repeat protein